MSNELIKDDFFADLEKLAAEIEEEQKKNTNGFKGLTKHSAHK